ncbi:MAG: hypothetical protein Q7S56_00050 [Nanoarchaeota archaeon]|nr:hypothetical protein [Nanoarchaeota archaeon]
MTKQISTRTKIFFASVLFIFSLIVNSSLVPAETTTVCDVMNCTVTFTTSNYSYPIPAGVTKISVLAIGGGGGGARSTSAGGGGAGGDLRYSSSIAVVPGQILNITVGGAGAASGGTGGFSNVSRTATLLLAGGGGGGTTAGNGSRNGTSDTLGGVVTGGQGGMGGTASGTGGCGGGGGAGGWYGPGGAGGAVGANNGVQSTGAGGGGAGGFGGALGVCGGGGGVGIGIGNTRNNGTAGATGNLSVGGGGSGGNNGVLTVGGLYGGGGGGDDTGAHGGAGQAGAVVITYDKAYPRFSTIVTVPSNNSAFATNQKYEFNTTITFTNGTSGIEFNGVNFTLSNKTATLFNYTTLNLGAGTYPYYYFAWGNGTFKLYNTTATQYYTIATTTSAINLTLNEIQGNVSITSGNSIYLNVSTITGDPTGRLLLYKDGTLINNGTSPIFNLTLFGSIGLFNITGFYSPSQNYSTSSLSYFVDVTAVADTCTYSSGNWAVTCSDNCTITSNTNLGGNNLTISGRGTFIVNAANITNFDKLNVVGESSSNQCVVRAIAGGKIGK